MFFGRTWGGQGPLLSVLERGGGGALRRLRSGGGGGVEAYGAGILESAFE